MASVLPDLMEKYCSGRADWSASDHYYATLVITRGAQSGEGAHEAPTRDRLPKVSVPFRNDGNGCSSECSSRFFRCFP